MEGRAMKQKEIEAKETCDRVSKSGRLVIL